jgi:GR25 family glycosyltransferase involved in LPS biosynthesis
VIQPFQLFDEVRIINLVDRSDRRREIIDQLNHVGGLAPNISFFDAHRPDAPGEFPSLGARGCFESHLAILREAHERGSKTLLVLEDDLDFTREGRARIESEITELAAKEWSFFYGAHVMPIEGRRGLVPIAADEPVLTTSFVAFRGAAIGELVEFLEAMKKRPAGAPDWGPMHVDGAYTVFRRLNPKHRTLVAFPSLGRQRSSPSDVTQSQMTLDQWAVTRPIASLLRRAYNRMKRN